MINKKQIISFAGCSWLMSYHLGVGRYIQRHLESDRFAYAGASSGSVAALSLAADFDIEEAFAYIIEKTIESQKRFLGPCGRMTRYLKEGFARLLPKDAALKAAGRLYVSVTELPRFKNRLFLAQSQHSNEDLINALLASCYIPIYYERPVILEGRLCIDGGLTDNCPRPLPDTKGFWARLGL